MYLLFVIIKSIMISLYWGQWLAQKSSLFMDSWCKRNINVVNSLICFGLLASRVYSLSRYTLEDEANEQEGLFMYHKSLPRPRPRPRPTSTSLTVTEIKEFIYRLPLRLLSHKLNYSVVLKYSRQIFNNTNMELSDLIRLVLTGYVGPQYYDNLDKIDMIQEENTTMSCTNTTTSVLGYFHDDDDATNTTANNLKQLNNLRIRLDKCFEEFTDLSATSKKYLTKMTVYLVYSSSFIQTMILMIMPPIFCALIYRKSVLNGRQFNWNWYQHALHMFELNYIGIIITTEVANSDFHNWVYLFMWARIHYTKCLIKKTLNHLEGLNQSKNIFLNLIDDEQQLSSSRATNNKHRFRIIDNPQSMSSCNRRQCICSCDFKYWNYEAQLRSLTIKTNLKNSLARRSALFREAQIALLLDCHIKMITHCKAEFEQIRTHWNVTMNMQIVLKLGTIVWLSAHNIKLPETREDAFDMYVALAGLIMATLDIIRYLVFCSLVRFEFDSMNRLLYKWLQYSPLIGTQKHYDKLILITNDLSNGQNCSQIIFGSIPVSFNVASQVSNQENTLSNNLTILSEIHHIFFSFTCSNNNDNNNNLFSVGISIKCCCWLLLAVVAQPCHQFVLWIGTGIFILLQTM